VGTDQEDHMLECGLKINVNGTIVEIIKHIGKGKGGDSYLARYNNRNVVFKKMHYEPCDTYTFESNKCVENILPL